MCLLRLSVINQMWRFKLLFKDIYAWSDTKIVVYRIMFAKTGLLNYILCLGKCPKGNTYFAIRLK